MGTKSTRTSVALLAFVLISGVTIAPVPAANAATTSVAGSSVENAHIAHLETIGDDQLHDCLTRIGEFPEALEGAVSPTPAFDDLARLKAELYFKHADLQGFFFATDNASLNDPNGIATLSIPVERDSASSFGAVWSEVTTSLNTSHVVLEQREGNGSVREVCAVFLDVLGSEELSAHIEGAAIDQQENGVVIFARDTDFVTAYAARAYGDLVRIEATEGAHEQSRGWSITSSANSYAVAIHRGYLGSPSNVMMATDVRYVISATSSTMM